MGRVSIGTCTGPAEAALVRAAFAAHEIPVVINGEQHASMMGGLAGAFVPLHILVADEDAEPAAALLRDLREHDRGDDDDEFAENEIAEEDPEEAASTAPPIEVVVQQRRRTVVAIMLALGLTFGSAHWFVRARLRSMALAGLEVIALRYIIAEQNIGFVLLFAGIAFDLIGAMWIIRHAPATIPRAVARTRS